MISWSSSFASSTPATSLNVTFFCELDDSFALLLPNDSALLPPLCIWRMKNTQKPIITRNGRPVVEQRRPRTGGGLLRRHGNAAIDQLVRKPLVLRRRVGAEGLVLRVLGRARDLLAGDHDTLDVAGVDGRHELTEGELVVAGFVPGGEVPDEHAGHDQHHPEQQALQSRIQHEPPTPLSLKITTACAGSDTRNSQSSACPATQTMRSAASTTIGMRSRSARGTFRSTSKSCSFRCPAADGISRSPAADSEPPVRRPPSLSAQRPSHRSGDGACSPEN